MHQSFIIGKNTMSLITWNDQLTVGIEEIDQQHHKLVQLINGLHNHMLAGDASEIMNKVLDRVIEYTGFHFGTEEQLMLEHDYPDSTAHKLQHKELVDTALALQAKLKSGNAHLTMETMHFLQDWLQHHILGSDKKFADFLITKGVQ
jgi:hemerythrin-like metal-binding protein